MIAFILKLLVSLAFIVPVLLIIIVAASAAIYSEKSRSLIDGADAYNGGENQDPTSKPNE